MIIDFHTHVFSPAIKQNRNMYCSADSCFGLLYSQPKARLCDVKELIDSMDECGIDRSVLQNIGWVKHDYCIASNDYILECLAKYPNRFTGFCSVQPNDTDNAIREIERCSRSGIKGIGELRPDVQGFDLCDATIRTLFDVAISNNLVVSLHASEPVGHGYQGKGDTTPQVLYPFILMYPKLKVVLAHWGGGFPFYEMMPEVASALTNTYYDSAATPFLYKPQVFARVADIAGSKKIVFGSDWPLVSPQRIISQLGEVELSVTDREHILYRNAENLLGLKQV
ncbi:MAG: amidohydrolase family protein [Dehalococcoidia bacterium]|nr:amidohydrolase family protein [Dehalococcoidia bacterium]